LHTLHPISVGHISHLCCLKHSLTVSFNTFAVTTPTKTHFQKILGDTTTDYLAAVATYVNSPPQKHKIILTQSKADTYRYTSAGLYSRPYHFIDAQDNPPSSCGVDYSRDCGKGGCVVSAIKNYVSITRPGQHLVTDQYQTSRVQSTTLSAANVAQAAKVSTILQTQLFSLKITDDCSRKS
jgi:hypothetical protein